MQHICLSGMTRAAMVLGVPLRFLLYSMLIVGAFYGIAAMCHQTLLCTGIIIAWGAFLVGVRIAIAYDPHFLRLFCVKWLRDKGNGTSTICRYQRLTASEELSEC